MKITAYILSLLVVVLTAMPCIDEPQDNTCANTHITQSTSHTPQSGTDHCSPFCSCSCCQSGINIPFLYSSSMAVITYTTYYSTSQNVESNYFFEFYKPPKD